MVSTSSSAGWPAASIAQRTSAMRDVLPVLTPVGLDPAHPFPRILNKSLNFVLEIEGQDAFGRTAGYAVVQVPRALPRLIAMPREISLGPHDFVMLSSIVHDQVGELFPGMSVMSSFRDGVVNAYTPSLPELLLGLGGIAIAASIVLVALRILAFVPEQLEDAAPGAAAQ